MHDSKDFHANENFPSLKLGEIDLNPSLNKTEEITLQNKAKDN